MPSDNCDSSLMFIAHTHATAASTAERHNSKKQSCHAQEQIGLTRPLQLLLLGHLTTAQVNTQQRPTGGTYLGRTMKQKGQRKIVKRRAALASES
jgi:hypothetical protein